MPSALLQVLDWSLSDKVAETELPQVTVRCARCACFAPCWLVVLLCNTRRRLCALSDSFSCVEWSAFAHCPLLLTQGGLSHMVRFAGNRHARTYSFWLDVPAGAPPLSVRLFVKRVQASDAAAEALLSRLPDWVSPSVSAAVSELLWCFALWRAGAFRVAPTAVGCWCVWHFVSASCSGLGLTLTDIWNALSLAPQAVVCYQSRWQF